MASGFGYPGLAAPLPGAGAFSLLVWAKLNFVTSMTDRRFVVRTITLVVLTATVMFSFLGSARLWDRDEPRNARAAQEMLERGDWIVPTFNSELRSHKPVMFCTAVASAGLIHPALADSPR